MRKKKINQCLASVTFTNLRVFRLRNYFRCMESEGKNKQSYSEWNGMFFRGTSVKIFTTTSMEQNEGCKFYQNVLGSPKFILAPMVEQSELSFRMMCRELGGVQLCYTPMWHAGIFSRDRKYRKEAIEEAPSDRPLLFQFCANDPETFADACALAEPHCDGIDLNLGCPQVIAQRGHYGAFLMDEWDLVENIIKTASERISKPITCKIRVYESIEKTVEYAKRLEKAGAKIITVHGRMREQKGPLTGVANWDHIKAVKENVTVPVFANGNIQYLSDVTRCLEYTKADGVMVAEGALYNPLIFTGRQPPAWEMADEYIKYAEKYKTALGSARGHLFRLWHHCLCKFTDLRVPLGVAKSLAGLKEISNQLKERCLIDAQYDKETQEDSENPTKLPYWRCQPYVRPKQKNHGKRPLEITSEGQENIKKDKSMSKRKIRQKQKYENGKGVFPKIPKEKWPLCLICGANPWGSKCNFKRCKICCKKQAELEVKDCPGHRLYFHSNLTKPLTPKIVDVSETGAKENNTTETDIQRQQNEKQISNGSIINSMDEVDLNNFGDKSNSDRIGHHATNMNGDLINL